MGCGASSTEAELPQQLFTEARKGSSPAPHNSHIDGFAQDVVQKGLPSEPGQVASYAETGPSVDEEQLKSKTETMEKYPELSKAISQYKEIKEMKIESEKHWTSLQRLNETCPSFTLAIDEKNKIGNYCVQVGLHEVIVNNFKELQKTFSSSRQEVLDRYWPNTHYLFLMCINFTDVMIPLSKGLVDCGVVPTLLYFIKEASLENVNLDSTNELVCIVQDSILLIVNMSRGVPARVLNDYGVVDVLLPFVHSEDKSVAVLSLLGLAAIVDEEQNNLLMASPEPIKLILDLLESALCYKTHRLEEGTQWSAYELGDGISQLAVNDRNKVEIVKQGGLPVLRKFLLKAKDAVEEASAAMCFWMLAFNGENVKKIKELPDCIEKLRTLKTSSDSNVSSYAAGALWEIEQKAKRGEAIRASMTNMKKAADPKDDNLPHIMISYQWDVQHILIKLKNRLQQCGFRVWMDIDQMQGSTLEAMAKAVENSVLVLVCISSKYKESANCRSEAEYAFQLKKDIIPLMVEKNFKPDGWLGMIVGAKLWYDFAETILVQGTVDKLLKELKTRAPQAGVGAKYEATELLSSPAQSFPDGNSTKSTVSKWKAEDVMSWVKTICLSQRAKIEAFNNFDGSLLVELWKLKQECPTVYYSSIEKELGIASLMDILRFNKAISACLAGS